MANYANIKATIDANIKQNGNEEITGPVLNSVLNAMVTTIGAGYQYAGVATPSTNPGSPDNRVFYIAATAGTYTNFNGLVVADGEVVVFRWDSSWHKDVTGIATSGQVSQLRQSPIIAERTLHFIGSTGVTAQFKAIIGHKYRVYLENTWSVTDVAGSFKFTIGKSETGIGAYTNIYEILMSDAIPEYHDFVADVQYYQLWGRGNANETLVVGIQDITALSETADDVEMLESNHFYGTFVNGNLVHGALDTRVVWRVATNEILSYDRDIMITANDGFRFGIHYFENGVFVSDGGWQTKATITKGTTFKVVIARTSEGSTAAVNVDEFLSAIYVTNIIDYVDGLSTKTSNKVAGVVSSLGLGSLTTELPTRDGSKGNINNAYAVVWLDIPCAGYKTIRFRLLKPFAASGNIYVFCYTLISNGDFRDKIDEDISYGFYQKSQDDWLELPCGGLQRITIQAYETSLPQSYPSTFSPLRKSQFADGQGLQYVLIKDTTEKMIVHKSKVSPHFGYQGLTIVGDTIVQFNPSADDNSVYAPVMRWAKDDFSFIDGMTHNLGHAATIDYDSAIDAVVVGNGTSDTSIAPRLDIVLGANQKFANGNPLNYDDPDIIHIEFKTEQKEIGGSGLICCFGGNWREVFLATGQNAPRRIFRCILGVGAEDFSDQSDGGTDLMKWGTFISGKSDSEYNGTLKIVATYTGEETQVFQGMCYRAGFLYLACGYTQPLVHKIRLYSNGRYEIVQTNIPQDYNADGSLKSAEPEGLCFYDGTKMLIGLPSYGGMFLIDAF